MFQDDTGHSDLIANGYDNFFHIGPNYLDDMDARRAVLAQFQSYPENEVEGMATLVCGGPGGMVGKMFSLFQPAQLVQNPMQILSDMLGGGEIAGTIRGQSLSFEND
jgi:hypothetical protein